MYRLFRAEIGEFSPLPSAYDFVGHRRAEERRQRHAAMGDGKVVAGSPRHRSDGRQMVAGIGRMAMRMHVNVRIQRRWSFEQVRRAALALAREVERRAPDLARTSKPTIAPGPALEHAQREVDDGMVALVNVKTDYRVRATAVRFSNYMTLADIRGQNPAAFASNAIEGS
jgi:hypothetical protein